MIQINNCFHHPNITPALCSEEQVLSFSFAKFSKIKMFSNLMTFTPKFPNRWNKWNHGFIGIVVWYWWIARQYINIWYFSIKFVIEYNQILNFPFIGFNRFIFQELDLEKYKSFSGMSIFNCEQFRLGLNEANNEI